MTYPTLDHVPDLSASARSGARTLTWSPYSSTTLAWDFSASVQGVEPRAVLHDTYRFQAIEGATYDIFSRSYFDPVLLTVYDMNGNAIAANSENDDGQPAFIVDALYNADIIFDWVAPYSGTYYVSAGWSQELTYSYYSLSLYEDRGTVPAAPTLSISNESSVRAEGSSGSTLFTFNVTRSGSLTPESRVNWAVSSAQATGADFTGGRFPSGTVTFAPGQASAVIQVFVTADRLIEGDEQFDVSLSSPVGATIAAARATAVIRDDDAATLSISSDGAFYSEGDTGTTVATFTVTRGGPTAGAATVRWNVSGAEVQASDFARGVLPSGVLTFESGERAKQVAVEIKADSLVEPNEVFQVQLSSATGASIAVSSASTSIRNDDSGSSIVSIGTNSAAVREGQSGSTAVQFTVTRTGATGAVASVDWRVTSDYASDWDFSGNELPSGTVTFSVGETQKSISVSVAADAVSEGDEPFAVRLSSVRGANIGNGEARVTILNDDGSLPSGASAAPSLLSRSDDPLFDALTHGSYWNGFVGGRVVLSWALADSRTGFFSNPAPIQEAVARVLANYSSATNLEFNFIGVGAAAANRADIVVRPADFSAEFPGSSSNVIARAGFPIAGEGALAGDVWLNIGPWQAGQYSLDDLQPGGEYFFAIMHEVGHALGLKHPHDNGGVGRPTFPSIGLALDTRIEFTYGDGFDIDYFTVMSYNDETSFDPYLGDPAGLMPLDVYALQRLYGGNTHTNVGASTLTVADDDRQEALVDANGADTLVLGDSLDDGWIMVLDITELPDFFKLPSLMQRGLDGWGLAVPYLYQGEETQTWMQSLKWVQGVERVVGSEGADVIYGASRGERFEPGGGDDFIDAGSGDDQVLGGRGDDVLQGNAGNDTAIFSGTREGYVISRDGGEWSVRDRFRASMLNEGVDLLQGFEFLQFSDMTLPLTGLPRPEGVRPGAYSEFLFDSVYYLVSHGDAVTERTPTSALNHWRTTGASDGFSPTAWFDATWYENRWPDLKALQLSDDVLFWHFNLSGVWEGRAPGPKFDRFDGARYLAENRDVAAYVDGHLSDFLGSRSNGAIAHFILYGANESRGAFDLSGREIELGYSI